VLLALACTGLRISELASLGWSDIDVDRNMILVTGETASARFGRKPRQTKTGRGRSFPIHEALQPVLETTLVCGVKLRLRDATETQSKPRA
jgi:integrase